MHEDNDEFDNEERGEDLDGWDDEPQRPGSSMGYERMTSSMKRIKQTMETQRQELAEEKEIERIADKATLRIGTTDNFRALLKHRHRTFTGGWRASIDRYSRHVVGPNEFFRALRDLGYIDDAKVVWAQLSGGRGNVTLADIDPNSARFLGDFYRAYLQKIDSNIHSLVSNTESLRVDLKGLMAKCSELEEVISGDGFIELDKVFKALQLESAFITAADLEWLQSYATRGHKPEKVKTEEQKKQEQDKKEQAIRSAQKKAVEDFRLLCQHKYGGVIPAWRQAIDPENQGRLELEIFRLAVKKTGFEGNFDDLWKAVSANTEFAATLEELEPNAVRAVESFKKSCIARFGSVTFAFKELMAEKKPIVTRDEFLRWCKEIRFDSGTDKLLWQYLDDSCLGKINLEAIDEDAVVDAFGQSRVDKANEYLENLDAPGKPEHVTLVGRERVKARALRKAPEDRRSCHKELIKLMEDKYGSSVRCWRQALDFEGRGELTKLQFFEGCNNIGYGGCKDKVWKELEKEDNSKISLADLDPACGNQIRDFRERCIDKVGSVEEALKKCSSGNTTALTKPNPKLWAVDFIVLCKKIGIKEHQEKLFFHLDPTSRGLVTGKSLAWLSSVQDTEEKALARLLKRQVETHKKKQADKIVKNAAPTREAVTEQAAKSEETQTTRASKKAVIALRDKMLKKLADDYKSLARGWKLALDPDGAGELGMDDFLTGLEKLELLEADATEEQVTTAENLFHLLDPEETHRVTLASLDRGLAEQAKSGLFYALHVRWGSVQRAMEENEPEGGGVITVEKFKYMCQEAKFTSQIHRLIAYFDPEGTGEIDFGFIDKMIAERAKDRVMGNNEIKALNMKLRKAKAPHMYTETPNLGVSCGVEARDSERKKRQGVQLLGEFKKACISEYGSLQRAWKQLLCPNGGPLSKIELDSFTDGFEALGVPLEENIGALPAWQALGLKGATLSLQELDPGIQKDVAGFCAALAFRHGSIDGAIDATDKDGSYEINYEQFIQLCFDCQYRRNERRLFEYYGGEYDKKDSKINLSAIDTKAQKRVVKKRKADEENEEKLKKTAEKRHDVLQRRRKGLPDDPTEEELEEMEIEKEKEEANKQESNEAEGNGNDEASPKAKRAGEDPAKLFRAMMLRRFGTTTRAWRIIDSKKQAVLTKAEFSDSLRVTGYGGSASVLFTALGCKKNVCFKDIDPDAWALLAKFRNAWKEKLKRLSRPFEDSDREFTNRLDYEHFCKLCNKAEVPKPWDVIFDLLDVKCAGSLTWEEVKFLEEHYKWPSQKVIRQKETSLGGTRNGSQMARTQGIGHLALEMKPRNVFLPKSNSLPDLNPQLRPNWNERHTIHITRSNQPEDSLYLMKYVKVEDETRIARRIKKKIKDLPTDRWLALNMGGIDNDEEDDDDY